MHKVLREVDWTEPSEVGRLLASKSRGPSINSQMSAREDRITLHVTTIPMYQQTRHSSSVANINVVILGSLNKLLETDIGTA